MSKLAANAVTLTGTNTYSGTTTISAGTLQVGAGGTAGTLGTGSVVNNAHPGLQPVGCAHCCPA